MKVVGGEDGWKCDLLSEGHSHALDVEDGAIGSTSVPTPRAKRKAPKSSSEESDAASPPPRRVKKEQRRIVSTTPASNTPLSSRSTAPPSSSPAPLHKLLSIESLTQILYHFSPFLAPFSPLVLESGMRSTISLVSLIALNDQQLDAYLVALGARIGEL